MWLPDLTITRVSRMAFDQRLARQDGEEAAKVVRFDGSVDGDALVYAARNPLTPAETLWDLHEKTTRHPMSTRIRSALASNPNLPGEILDHYTKDRSVDVRKAAAQNPTSTPDGLDGLADDEDVDVLVAAHPNTTPGVLDRLAERHPEIVALNSSTSDLTLWALATSKDPARRRSVARRATLAPEALGRLRGDLDASVLAVLAGSIRDESSEGVLSDLAHHPVSGVRHAAATNPWTAAEDLAHLAMDVEPLVRLAVAQNPSAPGGVLLHLATTQVGDKIGYSAATHLNAPFEALLPQDVPTLGEEGRQRLWNLPGEEGAVVRALYSTWEGNVEGLLQRAEELVEDGLGTHYSLSVR